jgi:hypothetical protein
MPPASPISSPGGWAWRHAPDLAGVPPVTHDHVQRLARSMFVTLV